MSAQRHIASENSRCTMSLYRIILRRTQKCCLARANLVLTHSWTINVPTPKTNVRSLKDKDAGNHLLDKSIQHAITYLF